MTTTRPDDLEIYRDTAGRYRWRRVAANGRIVADSGQSYRTSWGAKRAAKRSNPGLSIWDMRNAYTLNLEEEGR
jgi:uncharacterized protein YegP (UPF0339 family)